VGKPPFCSEQRTLHDQVDEPREKPSRWLWVTLIVIGQRWSINSKATLNVCLAALLTGHGELAVLNKMVASPLCSFTLYLEILRVVSARTLALNAFRGHVRARLMCVNSYANADLWKKFVLTRDCHLTLTSRQLNSAWWKWPLILP